MKFAKDTLLPLVLIFLISALSLIFGAGTYVMDFTLKSMGESGGTGANTETAPEVVKNNAKIAVAPISDIDHIKGNIDAKIALIEYSDLECPYCQTFHETMKEVIAQNPDEFVWVFRNFPLSIHKGAQAKAEASECVASLGGNDKYWEYIDALFNDLTATTESLPALAASMGLDEAAITDCISSGKFKDKVKADLDSGSVAGITGTPGTVIYNKDTKKTTLIPGAFDYNQIMDLVETVKYYPR